MQSAARNNEENNGTPGRHKHHRSQRQNQHQRSDEVKGTSKYNSAKPRHDKNRREQTQEQSKVYDVLRSFKEDIVSAENLNETSRWKDKIDEIKYKSSSELIGSNSGSNFPLDEPPHEIVKLDEIGPKSSKLKSVVLGLTAFGNSPNGSGDKSEQISEECIGNKLQLACGIDKLFQASAYYSSGLLAGFLLWQGLFGISLIIEASSVRMGTVLWTAYWTLNSILILVTILGFLSRLISQDEIPFISMILHFAPSLLLIISHYLIKGIHNQIRECENYSKLSFEAQRKIHLTFSCENDGDYGNSVTTSLSLVGSLIAIGIYTFLHSSKRSINVN